MTKGFCKHPKQQKKHEMRQRFHSQSFTHSRAQEQLTVPHSTSTSTSSAGEEGEWEITKECMPLYSTKPTAETGGPTWSSGACLPSHHHPCSYIHKNQHRNRSCKRAGKKKKQGKKIKRRAWQVGFRVTSDLGFYDALHHALHAAAAAAVFAKKLKKEKRSFFVAFFARSSTTLISLSFFLFFLAPFFPPPQHLSLACVYGSKKRREKPGLAGR